MTSITSILVYGLLALSSNVAARGPMAVSLGTAANYAILAKSSISTVPQSVITGNIAVSPISAAGITGFSLVINPQRTSATSTQVLGRVTAANFAPPVPVTLITAVSDMGTAFTNGTNRLNPNFLNLGAGNLAGLTLVPGLYKWTTGVLATAAFTIAGGPTDVWIFQIAQTLDLSTGIRVTLSGGALARNIFWVATGAVSVGVGAHLEGIVLSATSITLKTGSSINGRLFAQTGVALQSATVVQPLLPGAPSVPPCTALICIGL